MKRKESKLNRSVESRSSLATYRLNSTRVQIQNHNPHYIQCWKCLESWPFFSFILHMPLKHRINLHFSVQASSSAEGRIQQARASVSCLITGAQLPETFRDAKRHDNLAIIGLVFNIRVTAASSLPELSLHGLSYPSRSAFVINTASPDGQTIFEAMHRCWYSWTAWKAEQYF